MHLLYKIKLLFVKIYTSYDTITQIGDFEQIMIWQ